jgi:integrase/recombinase XerD
MWSTQVAGRVHPQYVSALRFLFIKTMHRHFLAEHIPFPKSRKRLLTVLSPEEVTQLIDSARNLYPRTLLMTLYSTAMRRAELCQFCLTPSSARGLGLGCSAPLQIPETL